MLGADKNCDAEAFVEGLKARGIEPHVAFNGKVSKNGKVRKTAVPSEVAASIGYAISQRLRKAHRGMLRLEQDGGRVRTSKGAGLDKVRAAFVFAMAAYDIVRLPRFQVPGSWLLAPGEVYSAT
jgi:hypothetical protein